MNQQSKGFSIERGRTDLLRIARELRDAPSLGIASLILSVRRSRTVRAAHIAVRIAELRLLDELKPLYGPTTILRRDPSGIPQEGSVGVFWR